MLRIDLLSNRPRPRITKCADPLKGAIRPLGLDHPLVAVTECNVKERFFRTV